MNKMDAHSTTYILVTPFKNMASMLDGLFKSITSQTLRPALWVIADDGSTDGGLAKLESVASHLAWIVVAARDETENKPWLKYGSAVAFGLERALDECRSRKIEPRMIAILDADTVAEPDYFERLVRSMAAKEKTAMASGMITTEGGGKLEDKPSPRGCARVYSSRFLEEVGGFPVTASPDTVLEIKARNRGYSFEVVPEAAGLHRCRSTQLTGEEGLKSAGMIRYTLGMDFISALAWVLVYVKVVGFRQAVAYLAGYVEGAMAGHSRIDDAEVRDYFSGSWKRFLGNSETKGAIRAMLEKRA